MSFWLNLSQTFGLTYFGTLVAAAFGAFAGAWATSRRETKRAVVAELNSISAARMLAFSICNRYMGLKRQHILPMCTAHTAARAQYQEAFNSGAHEPPRRTCAHCHRCGCLLQHWSARLTG